MKGTILFYLSNFFLPEGNSPGNPAHGDASLIITGSVTKVEHTNGIVQANFQKAFYDPFASELFNQWLSDFTGPAFAC